MNSTRWSVFPLKITVNQGCLRFSIANSSISVPTPNIPECNFIELNVPIQPRNRRSLPMCQVTNSGLESRMTKKRYSINSNSHSRSAMPFHDDATTIITHVHSLIRVSRPTVCWMSLNFTLQCQQPIGDSYHELYLLTIHTEYTEMIAARPFEWR